MKKIKSYEEELKREQALLNCLIEEALRMPIASNEKIIEQSKKVNILIEKIQLEKLPQSK